MKKRGTSLVELMIVLIILGLCVSAMMAAATQAGTRATLASEKALILASTKDALETAKREARRGTLNTTMVTTTPALGLPYTVTIQRQATPIAGTPQLYYVYARATWNGMTRERQGTILLESTLYNADE